jgi:membrane-associated phospholipid phosphatase
MPSERVRTDADERAGRRLLVAAAGLVVLALVLGPVALLVHDRWTPLVRLDERTTERAERLIETVPGLLGAARAVTLLGSPLFVTVASVLTALVLWRLGQRRLVLYVAVVRLGSLGLSSGLKEVVGRSRPVFDVPVDSAFGQSFPSGHAVGGSAFWLSSAVLLLPLVPVRPRVVLAVAALVSVLVAASRVLLGVHFLSDVVAGLVLGAGWVAVCTYVFAAWRREEGRPVEPYEQGLAPELREGR